MFCMLLRKHLSGGRLAAIDQPGLERVVILTLDIVDELGEPGRRRLVFECMGRYSNLILLDGQGRIIDCLRRVAPAHSSSFLFPRRVRTTWSRVGCWTFSRRRPRMVSRSSRTTPDRHTASRGIVLLLHHDRK